MSKLLLFRGSPRSNIPEVENLNSELMQECDVLNVRYMAEIPAYKNAREWFLEQDYDYFAIATDDIVVKPEHIRQLKKNLGYPVISGMMNVDQEEYMKEDGNLNICIELALKDRKLRSYNWIKRNTLPKDDIFDVKFAGFGLTAIRRDIIERIEFAGDGVFRGKGMEFGASLDFVFCWKCHELGIPVKVDKKIDMQHLRTSGRHRVGEISPQIWFNNTLIKTCKHENKKMVKIEDRFYNKCPDCSSFC